jgi:hypothetical protein
VRYCTRPPLAQERLGRLNDELLVYRLRMPTMDGRTALILTPLELLDRLAHLVTPPRIHKRATSASWHPTRNCVRRCPRRPALRVRRCRWSNRRARGWGCLRQEDTDSHPLSADDGEPITPPAVLPTLVPGRTGVRAGNLPADQAAWPEVQQDSWD